MSPSRLVVASIVFLAGILALVISSFSRDSQASQLIIVLAMFITGPFFIGFSTAPDTLPMPEQDTRRAPHPWYAPLFARGGSRGLVLLAVSILWLFSCHLIGHLLAFRSIPVLHHVDTTQLAIFFMYCWIYVAVPSTFLPDRRRPHA